MSSLLVEPISDATQWTAVQPDGITPSTDLAVADELTVVGTGADGVSLRITATASATGHILRRAVPTVDVSSFSELRFSLRSSRRAGTGGASFYLEMRLGSAALPFTDPANTWHRFLPVRALDTWETVRLGIDDLDPAVATALNGIQLRCIDAADPFTAFFDDLIAVRPEMLVDADRALVARLSGISVGGIAVPATVRAAGQPLPTAPALDILNVDVRHAPARVRDVAELRDFSSDGARLVAAGDPFDLLYLVRPVAETRAQQAALIDSLLDRLRPFDELILDGDRLPIELYWVEARDRVGGAATDVPALNYRVGARRPVGTPQPIRRVDEVRVTADLQEAT